MSAPDFHTAAPLVPVIVVAFVVQVWTDAVSLGIDVSEKTRYAGLATWISVVAVLALYALLIPPFGAMGAAVATFLGYSLRFACTFYWSQALWPISWGWRPNLRLAGYALASILASEALMTDGLIGQLILGGLIGVVYLAAVLVDPLGADARALLHLLVTSPRSAIASVRSKG
jgi:O-antigen/teichoic acid export membrane protein